MITLDMYTYFLYMKSLNRWMCLNHLRLKLRNNSINEFKSVKSDYMGEYYNRYDRSGEQHVSVTSVKCVLYDVKTRIL